MIPILVAFTILWGLVYLLLDRWSIKTGVIVECEREDSKPTPQFLLRLQGWAGWIGFPILIFWGWVAFDRADSQHLHFFQALWKIALVGDSTGRLVLTGLFSVIVFFAICFSRAFKEQRGERGVVFAEVQLFGESRIRLFRFREPKPGVWPSNFVSEAQKKGALIAWRGQQIVVLMSPLHQNSYVSYGVTHEAATPFLAELQQHPDSPFGEALLKHNLLLEYKRQEQKQQQLALRQAERQAELTHQRALEADRRKKAVEKQELQRYVAETYEWNWSYPPAGLLLGTVRAHPLAGRGLSIPDHLRAEYDRHFYELPIWFTGEEMGLTFGSVGSGKFTAAIAANVLLYDGSCFVIDPKGEVCAVTASTRQKRGQKVYRLDPFDITRFAPGAYQPPLACYNPLDALDPRARDFADDAQSLAEVLVEPPKGDPYWSNEAKTLLTALIMFVCVHPDAKGARHLSRVHEYLNPDQVTLEWLLQEMASSSPAADYEIIRLCGQAHRGLPEKQREGIWAAARKELSIFALPSIKNVTSSSSFRFEELLEGGCTLYLVLDAQRLESHNRWLRLIMTISLMMAVRYRGQGERMLWIVDEAAQLGQNDILPKAYRLLRGYNVRMWTFWQDLGSLKKTYPHDWGSLISNSFVQVLSSGDYETSKYFCDLAGDHEVEKRSTGETHGSSSTTGRSSSGGFSSGGGNSWGPGGGTFSSNSGYNQSSGYSESDSLSFSRNTNLSWQWEPRVRVNDLQAMPKDRMYMRFPGNRAAFFTKFYYFSDAQLNALAAPNPFFKGRTASQEQQQQDLQRSFGQLLGSARPEPSLALFDEGANLIRGIKKFQPLKKD